MVKNTTSPIFFIFFVHEKYKYFCNLKTTEILRKLHFKLNLASQYSLFDGLYETCCLGVSPNFEITVACTLKFHWHLRTFSLKQKARTKIEVFLSLPCWLSQSILLIAFWNFKLKVLKYPRNCRLHALILKV